MYDVETVRLSLQVLILYLQPEWFGPSSSIEKQLKANSQLVLADASAMTCMIASRKLTPTTDPEETSTDQLDTVADEIRREQMKRLEQGGTSMEELFGIEVSLPKPTKGSSSFT